MRVEEIKIQNYRSLKDIHLVNLKNLNIFIGKNGSGKSHVLEAMELFFRDLNLIQQTEKGFEENLWYDRDNQTPIYFKLLIKLTEKQLEEVFNKKFFAVIGISETSKIKTQYLTIERTIDINRWNNKNIAFGDWCLVKDNQFNDDNPQMGFNDPIKVNGSNPKDRKNDVEQNLPRPSITPEIQQEIMNKLNGLLIGKFKIIQTTRESSERLGSGTRGFLVDPDTRTYLTNIGQNPARTESQKWSSYKKMFREYSTYSLEMRGGAIQAEIDDLYLPLNLLGGGDQEILILERLLSESGVIFGLEEPETHLHADYQRKLFNKLKLKSQHTQLFITTHSSIFVDKVDFDNSTIWLVKKDGKSTTIEPIIDKNDRKLKDILVELGIKMSDVLFPEKILFVEGSTEYELIPLIANSFKLDLEENDIKIIAMRGKDTGKYHIEMWHHIGKNANLPMFFIFDNDAKKEIEASLKKNLLSESEYVLLREQDIEDYYPEDKLKAAIESLYPNIDLKGVDLNKPRKKTLTVLFKKYDIYPWKVDLGKKVISSMEARHIKSIFSELKKGFDFLSGQ